MPRRREIGIVTKANVPKMRRVEIIRLVQHPRYKKYVKHRTICYVHDENDESRVGDQVEIMESRPLSRLKRWRLVRVVARGRAELIEKRKEVEVELQAVSRGESEESGSETSPPAQSTTE
ncbi:MAG: 30S ribosomal protein S17 [Thermogutta sp.]|uniref:30S ribosomal protein S17 n=1 Tax=Thermogutta sp. TaxID=1962930 RepID=UPI0019C35D8F|nr:30S ribosomal protein S17 [Thermogutta sp.]GIX02333.1 MAG: 30S ribosomal protein S17 [Thermogutta sp.]